MIINGFGGSSTYNGSGDQNWVNLSTFSLTGSYSGSMSGGSGDSHSKYILGSSSAFTLPNALAFRFVMNTSTTKFTSGTLSRYNSEWSPEANIEVLVTSVSYTAQYISSKNKWYSSDNCPVLYYHKRYLGSSSVSTAVNITTLESAATNDYYMQAITYNLSQIPNVSTTNSGVSDGVRTTLGASVYSFTIGKTAYVSSAITMGYYDGYLGSPAATVVGTLQYLPA